MANVIKTTFKFKRGLAESWLNKNPILAEGEPGFELDTGKLKIGNGKTPWRELKYLSNEDLILTGYYFNEDFYKDIDHTILLDKRIGALYIDLETEKIYYFDGNRYEILKSESPVATDKVSGTVKIYNSIGEQNDGTMTQKAISDELDDKIEMLVQKEEETLVLGYNLI